MTDSVKVIMGFCLMFAYTALMIDKSDGSMTWFDRIFLTAAGITSVAMGLLAGNGIAAALGLSYNPINASMPFICLGTVAATYLFRSHNSWIFLSQALVSMTCS